MPIFSIIIPVYNACNTLAVCLESILNQTFSNFEVICIDDGSTDNSLEILEKYAHQDKRIKVVSQINQGVSVARNLGLSIATGEYILFCDSDDKYKSNLCSSVASVLFKQSDVIAFGHENYIDGTLTSVHYDLITAIKDNDKLDDWLSLQVYVWEKAFKRSFLQKYNIKFPVGIKNAEDLVFCLLVYFSGAKYSLIEKALYEYNQINNGTSTFTNPDGIKNDTEAYQYLLQTDEYKRLSRKEKLATTNFFIGGALIYFQTLKTTLYREKLIKDLEKLLYIILNEYSLRRCLKMKNLRRIYKTIFKEKHKRFFSKFDIIFTLLGLKIKVKRRKHNAKG